MPRERRVRAIRPRWPLSRYAFVAMVVASAAVLLIWVTPGVRGAAQAYLQYRAALTRTLDLHPGSCVPLAPTDFSPIDFSLLASEWNVALDVVERSIRSAVPLLGCADAYKNENAAYKARINSSLLFAVYLMSKNVTENDAENGFVAAETAAVKSGGICSSSSPLGSACHRAPRVTESHDNAHPYLTFFLTSMDPVIAVPARQRLERSLGHGDAEKTDPGYDINDALDSFIHAHPEWEDRSQAYISLRENPNLKRAMISRFHDSGTCYLIAPFLALHYAINLHATKLNELTVDITEWLRKYLGSESLANFFFANGGAPTIDIVRQAFQPAPGMKYLDSIIFTDNQQVSSEKSLSEKSLADYGHLRALLERNGIGIIYDFIVYEELHNMKSSSFAGGHGSTAIGRHAMVVVGVRFDSKIGQYFLLLQNSWKDLQFFEVRQDYAKSCEMGLMFVTTHQHDYPSSWPTVTFHSAMTAVSAGVTQHMQGRGLGFYV
jgi:hypothetical protein